MSSDVVDTQTWCLNCTHSSTVIVSDLAMRGMMLTFSCNRFMNSISRGFSLGRKQRERRSFLKVSPSVHSCGASCGLSVMFHHSADLQRNIWMDQTAEKKKSSLGCCLLDAKDNLKKLKTKKKSLHWSCSTYPCPDGAMKYRQQCTRPSGIFRLLTRDSAFR